MNRSAFARATFILTTTWLAAAALPARPARAEVSVRNDGGVRHVKAGRYEADVAADGCLTNLRVDGGAAGPAEEFLKPAVDISRGNYFYQNGVVPTPTLSQSADNVIESTGDRAAVRYEFAADTVTFTATNKTAQPMPFFLIFDPAVGAVRDESSGGGGKLAKTPVRQSN